MQHTLLPFVLHNTQAMFNWLMITLSSSSSTALPRQFTKLVHTCKAFSRCWRKQYSMEKACCHQKLVLANVLVSYSDTYELAQDDSDSGGTEEAPLVRPKTLAIPVCQYVPTGPIHRCC